MEKKRRLQILLALIIMIFIVVVARLAYIQLVRGKFFEERSLDQRTRLIKLAAKRGDIFDRNGNLLATSIDTYSLYQHHKGWIARKLSQAEAEAKKSQALGKVSLLKEKMRVYPKGQLAAQVLGFVGVDNQGLSGIELALDEFLKGKEGQVVTEGDPKGRELYGALRELEPGADGMDVTLTIDENIQYVAEKALARQIRASRATSGIIIVMEAKTGEILALAGLPGYDPNEYLRFNKRNWRSKALDPYEPGSTFKLITVAAALQEGVLQPETKLQARDKITVGGKTITNALPIDWQGRWISISKMLEKSINTGSVQVGLKLGPEKFYKHIKKFGFGQRTGFGLWGESKGIIRHWQRWNKPDIAMITFGQTIAVTPLQLLAAVSAFADEGMMVKPYLIKKVESPDGKIVKGHRPERRRVLSQPVADQVKSFMRSIVSKGSGIPAQIVGFEVCGKTGTAQKARLGGRGYYKDKYIASFVGFAPYKRPKVIAIVLIDDPKGTIWGGKVCGPVFGEVVGYSLRYLNAHPDVL